MSPWDLEPIDEDRTVLPSEVASRLYRPRPEDWGSDRDSECDRISAELSKVMSLAIAKPFAFPVERNQYPSSASIVEYPMDLSTIKARLDNRFYRRLKAVDFDINAIFTNAQKFNQPDSSFVRCNRIIKELCMEIIRGDDTTAVANYDLRVRKAGGPSTSKLGAKRNKTKPKIWYRSRSNLQISRLVKVEDSAQPKSRKRVSKSKVSC